MSVRAFLDACVFIEVFAAPTNMPERLEGAKWALQAGDRGVHENVTSMLVANEVMGNGRLRQEAERRVPGSIETARAYFTTRQVRMVELDRLLMLNAMRLSTEFSLRGPDAIHLAAALRSECRTFFTYDGGFLKLNGSVNGIRFQEPIATGQAEFDV